MRFTRLFCALLAVATIQLGANCLEVRAVDAIDIGGRRELFVDDALIDQTDGDLELKLQRPQPAEVVLTTDKPWEGNTSAYYTVFHDKAAGLYRMYYRGSHFNTDTKKVAHPEVTCYAESKDGINWSKPELGLFEFGGSKNNNIVWSGIGTHCFAVFKDANPACAADARYKAISRGRPIGKKGLYAFQSPDGIHWSLIKGEPVITEGYFDSQNLAFWDVHSKIYREYHRTFVNGVRAIMTGTSDDFVNWTNPKLLDYGDAPNEHLYTNAVQRYERAPHMLIGFPTRYLPRQASRVEPVFMASRDGLNFKRWPAAVVPEDAPEDRSGNRSNYMTWGMVQLPGNDREFSVYATEAYYTGPDSRVRRFTYRVDGFVSAKGGPQGGSLTTKPIRFRGKQLEVNFATHGKGQVRVELQDANGKVIPGFEATKCLPLTGDATAQTVQWNTKAVLASWSDEAIRIKFKVTDGDLYSYRFHE
ncbi:MAG TPA: hypothetical protein QF564_19150 [Pirellulaceae bacterium]|nr:hypothetical protein [Pirellulaceae bacterium]